MINNNSKPDNMCNDCAESIRKTQAKEELERILALSSFSLSVEILPQSKLSDLPKKIRQAFCIGVGFPNQRLFRWRMIERCMMFILLIGGIHLWITTREASIAVHQVHVNGRFNIEFPDAQDDIRRGDIRGTINDVDNDILLSSNLNFKSAPPHKKKEYPGSPVKWLPELDIKEDGLSEDITLVTAYINIGSFLNDDQRVKYLPEMYHKWMTVFSRIENPVVAYMTDDNDIEIFKSIRANISGAPTKIIKVSNETLWAFSMKKDIQAIFDDPKYPKHSPNTFVADYACVMHAKYELTARTIENNPFKTKYMAWIDIGYFRQISEEVNGTRFMLSLPPKFDENRVSYGEVFHFLSHTEEEIFKKNRVWITGSFFLSKVTTLKQWIFDYAWYTERYLHMKLMNTDQQILYAMYFHRGELEVDIQTHTWQGTYDPWFQLGYVCKEEGEKLKRKKLGLPSLEEAIDPNSEKEKQKLIDI